MSNDAQRIFELFLFLNEGLFGLPQLIGTRSHILSAAPLSVLTLGSVVVLALLYELIYGYAFTGFAVLLLILPINILVQRGMQRTRGEMILRTDRRTKLLNEVLQAIKIVRVVLFPLPCVLLLVTVVNTKLCVIGEILCLGRQLQENDSGRP